MLDNLTQDFVYQIIIDEFNAQVCSNRYAAEH